MKSYFELVQRKVLVLNPSRWQEIRNRAQTQQSRASDFTQAFLNLKMWTKANIIAFMTVKNVGKCQMLN